MRNRTYENLFVPSGEKEVGAEFQVVEPIHYVALERFPLNDRELERQLNSSSRREHEWEESGLHCGPIFLYESRGVLPYRHKQP